MALRKNAEKDANEKKRTWALHAVAIPSAEASRGRWIEELRHSCLELTDDLFC